MSYTRMPFGKHKGENLKELPSSYIAYALEAFSLPNELDYKLKEILATRLEITSIDVSKDVIIERYTAFVTENDLSSDEFNAVFNFFKYVVDEF